MWDGWNNILNCISDFFESITFFLVVWLLLPLSEKMQAKHDDFKKFLYQGFIDRKQLEEAIHNQNPGMPEVVKEMLSEDLKVLDTLYESTSSAQSTLPAMISVD